METGLQSTEELEQFWSSPDPWSYDDSVDDELRIARVKTGIPKRDYPRTLDIGCGNGFITQHLPGDEVVGVDIAAPAVEWARRRVAERDDADRFTFRQASLFDVDPQDLGTFDLIVITGLLYPQYIGAAFTVAVEKIRAVCRPRAIVVSVQIDEWFPHRLPFVSLDVSVDPYREYTHRLEVFEYVS